MIIARRTRGFSIAADGGTIRRGVCILTTKEAAARTGGTPEKIRRAIRRGQLPAIKTTAGEWIIDAADLANLTGTN